MLDNLGLKDLPGKATRTGRNPFVLRSDYGQVHEGTLNAPKHLSRNYTVDGSRKVSILGRNSPIIPWVRVDQNGGSTKLLRPLNLDTH